MLQQPDSLSTAKPNGRVGGLVFATLVLCAAFGEVATFLLGPALPALGKL